MTEVPEGHSGWTFLTNHARVLAAIASGAQGTRIRDIAARCRLTERAVQKIIADLEQDGYLDHTRQGRTNLYHIQPGTSLRHPADSGLTVADLLAALDQHESRPEAPLGQRTEPSASDHSDVFTRDDSTAAS
ncbi:MarR family transcriptional regulator [Streptomyces sp. NBC_00659]|uniref:helix-turn-helix transcriptional regulator n=1 Tax=Streptomyces sp. NBC_00659 TaxID=2903669 RepID=UPI002E358B91|nr:helix-turn-helix domain-containing protein [Streptomyces sp. NBC_00659]